MSTIKKIYFILNFAFVILLIGCLPESTINRSPVITADFSYTVEVGDLTFNLEDLITIVDDNDGAIPVTSSMISYNDFSVFIIGSYDVVITVKDSDNLEAEATVVINVVDTVKPVITLTGDEEVTMFAKHVYTELGATCTDNYDETCEVVIDDSLLNIDVPGNYIINYSASDSSSNEAEIVTRTVIVESITIPVITLIGNDVVQMEVGSDYIDEGASCLDVDHNACMVVINSDNVNTNVLGSYIVTYNATDDYDDDAIEVTRTVNVIDTTKPVITLNGDSTTYVEVGESYTDLGANCTDNYDVCEVITTNGDFDSNILGTYTINYNAVDTSNNSANEVVRTVIVQDSIAPEITLRGDDTLYIDQDSVYMDLGAVCTDNYDTECNITTDISSLDLSTLGSYDITYNATDSSGNVALEITRTIIVQEASSRNVGLLGDEIYYLLKDSTWAGAGVYVPFEGDYTASVVGSVDTSITGMYRLQYLIIDELNHYSSFERIVYVVEEIPEEKNQVNLINMYNHNLDLYLEMVEYDANGDLLLKNLELDNVLDLDLSNLDLNDLYFIPYYDNLVTLNLNNNDLFDFDFVVDLPLLETLLIANNNIGTSDLCVLTDNDVIKELNVSNNYINNVDCLSNMSALTILDVSNNSINDFSTVVNSPNILELYIADNNINNLGGIDALTQLQILDVSGNPISSINDLLGLTELKSLDLENTNLTTINTIDALSNLEYLYLDADLDDYYILDYLFELIQVDILELDADLEFSFFIDYMAAYNITINTNSVVAFDLDNPNILMDTLSTTINYGTTINLEDYIIEVYDYWDGYMYGESITYSVDDTALLDPGFHLITITATDDDGNETSVIFELTVIDDYDLGNLIVFIRFSDETDFVAPQNFQFFNNLFNGDTMSLIHYYREVSFNDFHITTVFPNNDIAFYTDTHPRGYYQPYHSGLNPIGYQNDTENYEREYALLSNAINWLETSNLVSEDTILDYNQDGEIDVVTFLISGQVDDWLDLLWPHKYAMYDSLDNNNEFYIDAPQINGDYVFRYTFQMIGDSVEVSPYFNLGVFAHEMFHIIGAPDLYHYYSGDEIESVGDWGLMDNTSDIPSHMLLYMKETYGGWDQDQIDVAVDGSYNLSVSTSQTDNLIIIDLGYSNEYLYLEYRQNTGDYEVNIPYAGLLIYRVDKDFVNEGNVDGYYDEFMNALEEVFIFRELTYDQTEFTNTGDYFIVDDGDANVAALTIDGLFQAGPSTTIPMFFSDGTPIDITITITAQSEEEITVSIDFLNE